MHVLQALRALVQAYERNPQAANMESYEEIWESAEYELVIYI